MKKTLLFLAGVAVLASCAKEVAPEVLEEAPEAKGNVSVVADRTAALNTKVQYNPYTNGYEITWLGDEKMGIFTYQPKKETVPEKWTNFPSTNNAAGNPFKTFTLFKDKGTATFYGSLNAFGVASTSTTAPDPSFIYGIVPSRVGATGSEGKFTIALTTGNDFGSTATDKGKAGEPKLYIANNNLEANYITLYRSEETFTYSGGNAALPAMAAKPMSVKLDFKITATDKSVLKSLKLVAKNEAGDVVPFHTNMAIDMTKFKEYAKMTAYGENDYSDLYPTEGSTTAEDLTFSVSNYDLAAGKSVILPVVIFPTEKFATLEWTVTLTDEAGIDETASGELTWKTEPNKNHALGPLAKYSFDIELPASYGAAINELPEGKTLRQYIKEGIAAGKTHIKVANVAVGELYDYTEGTWTDLSVENGLVIPDVNKDITIEAPIKYGRKLTPYFEGNYTKTLTFKNITASSAVNTQEIVLNNANAKFVVEGEAYTTVTVKAAKEVSLVAETGTLAVKENAAPELVTIKANLPEGSIVSIDDKANINTLIVEKGGVVQSLDTKTTKNITINGSVASTLTVHPTPGGTNITVGKYTHPNYNDDHVFYGYVGRIITDNVDGSKYSSFTIDGMVRAEGTLNTQNASSVKINGDLSNVNVVVNATAGEGTEVKIGAGAQVRSLTPSDAANGKTYASFTIDGKVDGDALNTKGAAEVIIGSLTKDKYEAADPAIDNDTYAKVPALTTTGAETVTIGYKATVASLDPDTAKEITIDGTITGVAANEFGLKSLDAKTVTLGAEGSINGPVHIAPAKATNTSGTFVKLNGKVDPGENGKVRVGNVGSFTSGKDVKGNLEVANVDNIDITRGEETGTINFNDCNKAITVTDVAGIAESNKINFTSCTDASFTLTGFKSGETAQTFDEVNDVTLVGSTFSDLAIDVKGDVVLYGKAGATANADVKNTFKKVSIKANNITISKYNTFEGENSLVVIEAKGDVIAEGEENNKSYLNFANATIIVVDATNFEIKNATVKKIYSYVDATLTKCLIDEDGQLQHVWHFESDNTADHTNTPEALTFSVYECNVSTETKLKGVFTEPAYNYGTDYTVGENPALRDKIKEEAKITWTYGNIDSKFTYKTLQGVN